MSSSTSEPPSYSLIPNSDNNNNNPTTNNNNIDHNVGSPKDEMDDNKFVENDEKKLLETDEKHHLESSEKPSLDVEVSVDDSVETRCGLLGFRPDFLQPLARVACFTPVYGVSALVTSSLSVYVNSQVTTLERQFGFSSQQTGLIMAANDVGFLLCVLAVAYLAPRMHMPRALGSMTIVFGLSGLICSLPHFIFGGQLNLAPGDAAAAADVATAAFDAVNLSVTTMAASSSSSSSPKMTLYGDLCKSWSPDQDKCGLKPEVQNPNEDKELDVEGRSYIAKISLVIIFIGMMIQGFGKAPRGSLTIAYIDGNTRKTKTGFYMGIIIMMGICGPACAFLFGGIFSKMYVTLEPTTLYPKHPKWIGAWWLGYVAFGLIALVFATPLFCFPRQLPKKKDEVEDGKTDDSTANTLMSLNKPTPSKHNDSTESKGLVWAIKDFFTKSFRIWTNPIYFSIVASSCSILFMIAGASAYSPKYYENMFDLPTHQVNYIMAGLTLSTSCMGTFIGGWLSKRFKMTARVALKVCLGLVTLSFICLLSGFIFYCDQPVVYNRPGSEMSTCNDECTCADNSYFPICGDDGKTYYSPCTAGCGEFSEGVYSNCTCIPSGGAVQGMCPYYCNNLIYYVIGFGFRGLIGTMWIIPKIVVMIRCVAEEDKTLALGYNSFSSSLFGWMLGPIIFGNFIDTVCDIWDVTCDKRGRCLKYDNDMFRLELHKYMTVAVAMSVGFLVFANLYAWKTGCLNDKTNDDDELVNGGKNIVKDKNKTVT